jgi:membrane protease YdiL (CAAX protease family)
MQELTSASRISGDRPLFGTSQRRAILSEALWASADVTAAVAAIALVFPPSLHTTLVGLVFFSAVWTLVWRKDDERVRRAGLTLGGLVIPGRLDPKRVLRSARNAVGWALALMAIIAVPYFWGWRLWFGPRLSFSLAVHPIDAIDEAIGQVLVIALPEEAFYRGYLQSRFDEVWSPRWQLFGAPVGPGLALAALVFAVGHLATVQVASRLAVFFPALLFGWLRARTGGIGASVLFHASCNLYALLLGRGYGAY